MHHSALSKGITVLYFLSWNFISFGQKDHQRAKLKTSDSSQEISPNLYFDKLLLLKLYKILAKKVHRKMLCLMALKSDANSTITRIWGMLTCAPKSLKDLHFHGFFSAKYITFDLKKYRGLILHETEEWYKIWRNTDLWFGK